MDFDEIKNLIEADGGKFIIVENGKPLMVVTAFADYRNKLNKKNNSEKKVEKPIPKELTEEALQLEDLPL